MDKILFECVKKAIFLKNYQSCSAPFEHASIAQFSQQASHPSWDIF